ncbi:MAG: indole-3-glycerol phosphate synthase TrpC [Cyanobacteria bacterium]|nr:indole-3-glycerol phosphate synthase TrpC [Cyanobacteriota bacterium]
MNKEIPHYTGILKDIVDHKLLEINAKMAQTPLAILHAKAFESFSKRDALTVPAFETALRSPLLPGEVHLILEVKSASPSAGVIQGAVDLPGLVSAYQQSATCISVLTDEKYFDGSLDRLKWVSGQVSQPTLCKDFILHPYQVAEAFLAGAGGVLLIVKILDDDTLSLLYEAICRLGMTPVVEIQNQAELKRAMALNPSVLMINNRNLNTFEVSLETTLTLATVIPSNVLIISASGISTREQIESLLSVTSCFLIGTAVMKQNIQDLPQHLNELKEGFPKCL